MSTQGLLDATIQAQYLRLLRELQEQPGVGIIFITHDFGIVAKMCDRVAVMYLGRMVELADRGEIYRNPLHPSTKALLSAVPIPDPVIDAQRERILLTGEVPSQLNPPRGCVFHPRCPVAIDDCSGVIPEMREVEPGHWAACLRAPGFGCY